MSKLNMSMRIALGAVAVAATIGGTVTATSTDAVASSVTSGNRVACGGLWLNDHRAADEDRCRDKGWTVRVDYILSADGHKMWTGYPPCQREDGHRCYWNARTMGNHRGQSFVQMGELGRFIGLAKINGRNSVAPMARCPK